MINFPVKLKIIVSRLIPSKLDQFFPSISRKCFYTLMALIAGKLRNIYRRTALPRCLVNYYFGTDSIAFGHHIQHNTFQSKSTNQLVQIPCCFFQCPAILSHSYPTTVHTISSFHLPILPYPFPSSLPSDLSFLRLAYLLINL